jgi:hypothetical protein
MIPPNLNRSRRAGKQAPGRSGRSPLDPIKIDTTASLCQAPIVYRICFLPDS